MLHSSLPDEARNVLDYWFGSEPAATASELEARLDRWFSGADQMRQTRERYGSLIERAQDGGLAEWEVTLEGQLALIVVLDQLRRSYFGMEDGRAYAEDPRAQRLSLSILDAGVPASWSAEHHFFALVPLGHAEDLDMQKRAMAESLPLIKRAPHHLRPMYEIVSAQLIRFRDVIERFGRFPHRNAALGRPNTAEEVRFLQSWQVKHPAHGYADQIAESRNIEKTRDHDS